ncbi:MAG: ABC transporter ATP-binding protein [Pseudomonadota bacterium]
MDVESLGPEPFEPLFAPAERIVDPFQSYTRPSPPGDLVAFMSWALRDLRWPVIAFGVAALVFGAAEAATFYLIGGMVDRAVAAGPADFFAAEWPFIVGLVVLIVALKPAAQLAQGALMSLAVAPGIYHMTLWRLHRHTLGQSMRYFEEDFAGRISQKQLQTSMALATVVTDTLSGLGMLAAYLIAMAVLLAAAEPWLAVLVAVWTVAFSAAIKWSVPRVRARAQARAAAKATVTGQLVDSLSHMKTVKLFAHAQREEDAARTAITDLRTKALAFGHSLMSMRVMLAIINATLTLSMIFGALYFWSVGDATIGVVAMASMMTLRLTAMSNWMAQSALSIFGELGTIEDGAMSLSPPHEVVDREGAVPLSNPAGPVRFDNVVFRYGNAEGGLNGLSFTVSPGEKVGLVGRSGAGKSTTVATLLRLYDREGGMVTIGGDDVEAVTQDSLRRAIATVTQETAIFNRSALDNVRYGRPDASEDAVHEAARRARAHDFILGLSDAKGRKGYSAHLGERGVKLSGGQRQRIALARAILKDAPILVLDEATSALDSEVEAQIQSAFTEVMQGKTVIAIAHRLSTIAAMDRIVVLDQGRVVEEGPHHQLLARGGIYADLWSRQSGGFLADRAA